ncbi:MAG: hypothetical protein F3741_10760 [Nitrospinae bacterium]|nr:hypothetical protein [Nitrospinota bacterium]
MMTFKKLINTRFVLSLIVLIMTLPLEVNARVFDKVAAKVNTEIITLSTIEERAELLRRSYSNSSISVPKQELLRQALNIIVEEKLQLQEGKKMGFVVDEESIDAAVNDISRKNGLAEGQLQAMLESEGRSMSSYREHIKNQILVSKISRFEIGNRVKVSDREIMRYYRDHQKEFWQDSQVRARHILFIAKRDAPESVRKEKLKQAKNVLTKILDGADFAELARIHSEDISASDGGDIGIFGRGKMVREFEEAAFSMKKGQVSDIVETEYGYHIIKVEEVLKGKTLTLKDARERISQILAMEKQKQGYEEWIGELKKSAFIEVSLFADRDKNKNAISGSTNKKVESSNIKSRKKIQTESSSRQQSLQKKWEQMYKSVEKSKENSKKYKDSGMDSLEKKLKYLKKLRNRNKISEEEYQKRKENLLNSL